MPRRALVAPSPDEAPSKREGLKLAQIASYDDLLTDALVDRVYFWTRIRKNRSRYFASRSIREDDVTNILRQSVVVDRDSAKACIQLLDLPGLKRSYDKLSKDDQGHFQRHLRKYVDMYLPDCPFEVSTTNRYTIDTHEAATTARKPIRKGEAIKYLVGIQVPITPDDEKTYDISRQDFSIVMSSRKRTQSLFLGPARFANHDCHANAKLTTKGSHSMTVIAARDIAIGEEITVSYGGDYFGIDNCECLCATCEGFGRNGWDPTMTSDSTDEEGDENEVLSSRAKRTQTRPFQRTQRSSIISRLPTELQIRIQSCEDSKCTVIKHLKAIRTHLSLVKNAKNDILRLQASRTAMLDHSMSEATPEKRLAESELLIDLEQETKELEADLAQLASEVAELDSEFASINATITSFDSSDTPHTPQHKYNHSEPSTDVTPRSLPQHPRLEELRNSPLKGFSSSLRRELQLDEDTPNATGAPRGPSRGRSTSSSPSADRSHRDSRVSTPATSFSEAVPPDLEEGNEAKSGSVLPPPHPVPKLQDSGTMRLTRSSLARSPRSFLSPSSKTVTEDEDGTSGDPTSRRPGDYTLTRRLLGTPYSRWVECRVCDEYYVQTDSYHLRWSCPRCERHSKLYGYQWPKTDKEGKHDTEERVLDHRVVNRFVAPEEVKSIKRGKKTIPIILDGELQGLEPESTKIAAGNDERHKTTDKSQRGQKRRQADLDETEDEPLDRPKKRGRPANGENLSDRLPQTKKSHYKLRKNVERKVAFKVLDGFSRSRSQTEARHRTGRTSNQQGHFAAEVKAVRTKRQYIRSGMYAGRQKKQLSNQRQGRFEESRVRGNRPATTDPTPRRTSLRKRWSTVKLLDCGREILEDELWRAASEEDSREYEGHAGGQPNTDETSDTAIIHANPKELPGRKTKYVRCGKYVGRYTSNVPMKTNTRPSRKEGFSYSAPVDQANSRDTFGIPREDVKMTSDLPGQSVQRSPSVSEVRNGTTSFDLPRGSRRNISRSVRNATKREDRCTPRGKIYQSGEKESSESIYTSPLESGESEKSDVEHSAPLTRNRGNPTPRSVQEMIKSANSRRFDLGGKEVNYNGDAFEDK